jgi:hypothetical protein
MTCTGGLACAYQIVPSLRITLLALQPIAHVHVVPEAHMRLPVQVGAPPLAPGQHDWPAAPQRHIPPLHVPAVHWLLAQQTWLAPPQTHVPPVHWRLEPQGVLPLQHMLFLVPQATQVVPVHS